MIPALVYLNNYLHDLATAFFFVSTLFAWWSRRRLPLLYPEVSTALKRVALISFLLILALGQVRAWNYTEYEWLPALGRNQIPILIGKHIILFLITVWAGVAWLVIRKEGRASTGESRNNRAAQRLPSGSEGGCDA